MRHHQEGGRCHGRNPGRFDKFGMIGRGGDPLGGRRGGGMGGRFGGDGGRGGRGGRMFGHGGLRLLLLHLIAEKPRHGYELIKDIEERLHGGYSPSPGVVYPTLTLLEEQGYASVEETEGGRKRYAATDAGRGLLAENAAIVEAMVARMDGVTAKGGRPPQIVRAVENLRTALRLRLQRGALAGEEAEAVAAALDAAARAIEKS